MEAVTGLSAALSGPGRTKRRVGLVAVLAAAAISLTSCAIGQHAATAIDKPAVAGTEGSIGSIKLLDVSIKAPDVAGRTTGTKFYVPGDTAPLIITLVNSGHAADTLTSVTSTAFSSWSIIKTGANPLTGAGQTSQVIAPQTRVALGLTNLGAGIPDSPQTMVLTGLTAATGNLYPGTVIPITFTFATAGSVTLQVPVDLTSTPTTGSIAPLPGTDAGA